MMDRFDLEQDIVRAWNITDDLKDVKSLEEVEAIRAYYELKFEKLWNTFEGIVANYNFVERMKSGK